MPERPEQGWRPLPRPLCCSSDASGRFEMSQDIASLLWHPLCQIARDSPWTQVKQLQETHTGIMEQFNKPFLKRAPNLLLKGLIIFFFKDALTVFIFS